MNILCSNPSYQALRDLTLLRRLIRWGVIGLFIANLNACTTAPAPSMPAGDDEPSSYPMPTTGTMQSDALNYAELNADAIAWSQEIVREQGWLFALGELKSLERGLISPNTALFIESQLLWLAGQTREATAMLNQIEVSDEASYDRLLAERQRRAAESGNPIDAARFALERLQLGYKSKSSVSDSDVLNLLSIASEQQIAAALRKAEPMSDWGWWLKLNLAYRQGRPAFMRWREAELQRPRGLQDLPASITTWINSDLPVRVAVLLPLSGRLKDAGERESCLIRAFRYSPRESPKDYLSTTVIPC